MIGFEAKSVSVEDQREKEELRQEMFTTKGLAEGFFSNEGSSHSL